MNKHTGVNVEALAKFQSLLTYSQWCLRALMLSFQTISVQLSQYGRENHIMHYAVILNLPKPMTNPSNQGT